MSRVFFGFLLMLDRGKWWLFVAFMIDSFLRKHENYVCQGQMK